MSCSRIPLPSFVAALALAACATPGGFSASPGAESAEPASGIQTRAIRSAPATQQMRNESRPLSELNTPEAIAARELAKSSGLSTAPAGTVAPVTVATAAGAAGSAGATPRAPAGTAVAATASAKPAALQKGQKVRLRRGAVLAARPSAGSESATAVASQFELGAQIYNAGGYWWYVSSGSESGWVLQSELQP